MNRTVRLRVWMLTLLVLAALVVGVGAGSSAKTKTTDTALASTSSTSTSVPLSAAEAAALAKTYDTVPLDQITVPPTTQATTPAGPKTSFGDGVWEVGVDIAAGKYKAADAGADCYWEKQKADDSTINNDLPHGPTTVTIDASVSKFKTARCGTWVKVA